MYYICITSQWEYAIGHLESILNDNNVINVRRSDFINEWKEIFSVLIKGLINCGYDKKSIVGMEKLIILHDSLDGSGTLYR